MADKANPWIELSGEYVNVLHITRIARDRDGYAVIHFTHGGWLRCAEPHSKAAPLILAAHQALRQSKAEEEGNG